MNLQTIRRPYHFYAFVWFAFFTVVAHMPLWFTGAIAGKHLLMALLLDSVCFWTALYFARTTEHLVAEEEERIKDLRVTAEAQRGKSVKIIAAEAEAAKTAQEKVIALVGERCKALAVEGD